MDDTPNRRVEGWPFNGYPNIPEVSPNPKHIEQPQNHHDHYDDVQDLPDLAIHGDDSVNEPEQNPDDDECNENCDQ